LKVRDLANNTVETSWNFTIEDGSDPGETGTVSSSAIIGSSIGVVALLVLAGAGALLFMRRRKEEEARRVKEAERIKNPGLLKMSIPAPAMNAARPAPQLKSAPAPDNRVMETTTGVGYIRPESKGKEKDQK
jgi:MYXO-CTERM domain-containing protein